MPGSSAHDNAFHEMIAGSFANFISRFCIAPFDVLKIRFQIQEQTHPDQKQYRSISQAVKLIIREEGILAFWKGNLAAELMVLPYGAVSFLAYSQCRNVLENAIQAHYHQIDPLNLNPAHKKKSHHIVSLASGSFSGLCATTATYPLDLLRTRFAAQQEPKLYHSLAHAARMIWSREGLRGFYVGMWPTLVGIVPLMALQFGSYEAIRQAIRNMKAIQEPGLDPEDITLTFVEQGMSGFLAGVTAKFLTMPLDTIKRRFQVAGFNWELSARSAPIWKTVALENQAATASNTTNLNGASGQPFPMRLPGSSPFCSPAPVYGPSCIVPVKRPFTGVVDCAWGIIKHEGWKGLFKGSIPSLLKAGPNSAIIYLVYEVTIQALHKHWPTNHKRNN